MRKNIGLAGLVGALVAVLVTAGPADGQLFRRNAQKVVVNNGGAQAVQVRTVKTGRLFNRTQVTEVTVVGGQQQFIRQPQRVVVPHVHAVNLQLLRGRQVRQLDQLNTYSYVHNTAAAVRFVQGNQAYVQQYVQAPVQVQSYSVQVAAPVVVQEYTQPAPVVAAQCDGTCQAAAAPAVGDPGVQYSTAPPQRVVQRVVAVQRPVAITRQVYVQTAPVRVRQFVQYGCN